MQDFTSQLLRAYFASTDWHPYNSYLHLTSFSSSILLDFPIPSGLSFSISSTPSPIFYSTHKLRALPQLAGSLGYVFASTDRPLVLGPGVARVANTTQAVGGQNDFKLQDVLERFRIVNAPTRPQERLDAAVTTGEQQAKRDYLLYGCIHAPTARLDALYTTRIAPTWNLIVTACSFPPRPPSADPSSSGMSNSINIGAGSPGATNLQLTLQNDIGKWFNEFSYSVDDALWGFRTMHHFGPSQSRIDSGHAVASQDGLDSLSTRSTGTSVGQLPADLRRTDEDSPASQVGGGLKGRFSAGAEFFFSALEKSAGLSTGVRFTTLPEDEEWSGVAMDSSETGAASPPPAPPSQPPTTITATLNPMMGHLSTAYAARMGKDIAACSRFDFNVYSYESELTVGGEFWLRSSTTDADVDLATSVERTVKSALGTRSNYTSDDRSTSRSQDLRANPTPSNVSLRERRNSNSAVPPVNIAPLANRAQSGTVPSSNPIDEMASEIITEEANAGAVNAIRQEKEPLSAGTPAPPNSDFPQDRPEEKREAASSDRPPLTTTAPPPTPIAPVRATPTTSGLLKWSLNSNLLLSLLWQGRLRNCLVAVGIKADLAGGMNSVGGLDSAKENSRRRFQGGVGSVIRGIGMDIVWWGGGGGGGGRGGRGDESKPTTMGDGIRVGDAGDQSSQMSFGRSV